MTEANTTETKSRIIVWPIAKLAAASIAPAWPLDQSVAVNPWWPQRHTPIERTFAEQAVLTGQTGLMDRAYYRSLWQQQIKPAHLAQALKQLQLPLRESQLEEDLLRESPLNLRWKNTRDADG